MVWFNSCYDKERRVSWSWETRWENIVFWWEVDHFVFALLRL